MSYTNVYFLEFNVFPINSLDIKLSVVLFYHLCVAIVSQNLEDRLLDFKKSKSTLLPSVATTIRSDDPAWAHGYTALANIKSNM